MQKVYLLLRGNQQNGPYTLDELLQFDLKPVDLIWIEGKSAGWYYPQEIKELLPHLPFVKPAPVDPPSYLIEKGQTETTASPKKVFVSMPAMAANPAALKNPVAEEVPLTRQTYTPAVSPDVKDEVKTGYARSLEEVEADYTNRVYDQKTKKRKEGGRKKLAITAIVIAAAVMVFAAINHFSSLPEEPVQQDKIAAVPAIDSALTNHSEPSAIQPASEHLPVKKHLPASKTAAVKTVAAKPVSSSRQPVNKPGKEAVDNDETKPAVKTIEETPATVREEKPVAAEAPKEKKKKLKDKILDLFKKKETPAKEEAKGVEVEDGERRSVHRQSDADLAGQVRIKFTIPNDWMMGIKGAKISLTNKSNQTITKASVDVLYYNEDNELLQTRTVSFGKIESKETGTVAIPDHAFADRVEYKIVSVQGAGEPLAGR